MFLALCTETIGWYMREKLKIYDNALPFNILMVISSLFFIWFLSTAKEMVSVRKWLFGLNSLFAVFSITNLVFFQGLSRYNSFSESLADIIIALICCYFLFTLVQSNTHMSLLRFDYFWIANGLLFYCLGSAMLYQFSYLLMDYDRLTHIDIGTFINYALNIILYTSLIIGFICKRQATR